MPPKKTNAVKVTKREPPPPPKQNNNDKKSVPSAAACLYCLELRIVDPNTGYTPTHSYRNCPNKARYYSEKGDKHRFQSNKK